MTDVVIVIADAPHGFHVDTEPYQGPQFEMFNEDYECAASYACRLASGSRWRVEDRTSFACNRDAIVVEQLNEAQWHALFPRRPASGVNDWCTVVADALRIASLDGDAIISVALSGRKTLVARAEPNQMIGGAR